MGGRLWTPQTSWFSWTMEIASTWSILQFSMKLLVSSRLTRVAIKRYCSTWILWSNAAFNHITKDTIDDSSWKNAKLRTIAINQSNRWRCKRPFTFLHRKGDHLPRKLARFPTWTSTPLRLLPTNPVSSPRPPTVDPMRRQRTRCMSWMFFCFFGYLFACPARVHLTFIHLSNSRVPKRKDSDSH